MAVAAMHTGNDILYPRMVVLESRVDTSRRHRGRSRYLKHNECLQYHPHSTVVTAASKQRNSRQNIRKEDEEIAHNRNEHVAVSKRKDKTGSCREMLTSGKRHTCRPCPMAEFIREKSLIWLGHVQRRDEYEGAILQRTSPLFPSNQSAIWPTLLFIWVHCWTLPFKWRVVSMRGSYLTEVSSLVRGWLPDHVMFFCLQLLSLAGNTSFQWCLLGPLSMYSAFYLSSY